MNTFYLESAVFIGATLTVAYDSEDATTLSVGSVAHLTFGTVLVPHLRTYGVFRHTLQWYTF